MCAGKRGVIEQHIERRLFGGVVVEVLGNGPPAATIELVGAIDGYVGEVHREQETGRTPYEVCERFAG